MNILGFFLCMEKNVCIEGSICGETEPTQGEIEININTSMPIEEAVQGVWLDGSRGLIGVKGSGG